MSEYRSKQFQDPTDMGGFVTANILLCVAIAVTLVFNTSNCGRYAVMAWPGSASATAFNIVARAGGAIIAAGGSSIVVIAQSDDPEFRARLFAAGAFLVFNPLMAGPCGSKI